MADKDETNTLIKNMPSEELYTNSYQGLGTLAAIFGADLAVGLRCILGSISINPSPILYIIFCAFFLFALCT
jgi:hypothetical protein